MGDILVFRHVMEAPSPKLFTAYILRKQVKQVYNDQPLGILALGKIGGGYGSLVSVVFRVPGYLEMVPGYLGWSLVT